MEGRLIRHKRVGIPPPGGGDHITYEPMFLDGHFSEMPTEGKPFVIASPERHLSTTPVKDVWFEQTRSGGRLLIFETEMFMWSLATEDLQ